MNIQDRKWPWTAQYGPEDVEIWGHALLVILLD